MLLSKRDVDVLRLLCWCQYIQPRELYRLATKTELHNLLAMGVVKVHGRSGALVLTGQGTSFLSQLFDGAIPKLSLSYHEQAIVRRLRLSRLTLTAYQGGLQVFTTAPEELYASPSLFLSAVTRCRGSNPWGSTRIAAVAHLGDRFYALHFVCPGIGRLALTDELTAFSNHTAQFPDVRRAFLFAGDSCADVFQEISFAENDTNAKLIHYGEAYRSLRLPVHLLSCDDTGAMQLRIMAQPDYRRRLTMAALKQHYEPPPGDVPTWDALFQGTPFVMAADMDLRRIDSAIETANERGYKQIAIAALEGQGEDLLLRLYRDNGQARFFALTDSTLAELFGSVPTLYAPARTQYLTEKGDVVDAPPIQIARKARRSPGK